MRQPPDNATAPTGAAVIVCAGLSCFRFGNSLRPARTNPPLAALLDGKKVVGIGDDKKDYYVFGAVFGNCEVVIPDTVTYIGDYAFTGAKGLVKLSGGENCKKIGEYAFMNCVNLAEVTFLDNVTDLADNAFAGCTKWESLHS